MLHDFRQVVVDLKTGWSFLPSPGALCFSAVFWNLIILIWAQINVPVIDWLIDMFLLALEGSQKS